MSTPISNVNYRVTVEAVQHLDNPGSAYIQERKEGIAVLDFQTLDIGQLLSFLVDNNNVADHIKS